VPSGGEPGSDRDRFPGSEWLRGERPSEILNRLVEGDPLELAPRVAKELAAGGWFVEPQRAWLRAAARTAYRAIGYRGSPPLDPWLADIVRRAVRELVEEQDMEELRGDPPETSVDAAWYEAIEGTAGLEPGFGRLACVVVNRQGRSDRIAFRKVVLERASIEDCVAAGLGSSAEIVARFERVTLALADAVRRRPGRGRTEDWDHGN
jgi:hypothetical protein